MMNAVKFALLLLLFAGQSVLAQSKKNSVLDRAKSSVVFISNAYGEGSGFVISRRAGGVYCLTALGLVGRQGNTCKVQIAPGTRSSLHLDGKVVAVDAESQLAVVRVESNRSVRALPLGKTAGFSGREVCYRAYSGAPSPGRTEAQPAKYEEIQLMGRYQRADGLFKLSIPHANAGQLGGPILDARGKVLGVITSVEQARQAVVIEQAWRVLQDRVFAMEIRPAKAVGEASVFDVEVRAYNPFGSIASVSAVVAPVDRQVGVPVRQALRSGRAAILKMRSDVATGAVRVATDTPHMIQLKIRWKGGRTTHSVAIPIEAGVTGLDGKPWTPEGGQLKRPEGVQPKPPVTATRTPGNVTRPVGPRGNVLTLPPLMETVQRVIEPLAQPTRVRVPERILQLEVAHAGRLAVMRLVDTQALVVLDLVKANNVAYIDLPSSDFVFGAGGTRAVVYLPELNQIQTFDLLTRECLQTSPNPFRTKVLNFAMGHSRGDVALVRLRSGEGKPRARMLDLRTHTASANSTYVISWGATRSDIRLSANHDLTAVAEWSNSTNNFTYAQYAWRSGKYERHPGRARPGYSLIGNDGRTYNNRGEVYDSSQELLQQFGNQQLVPDCSGRWFVGLNAKGTLLLYLAETMELVAELGSFPSLQGFRSTAFRADQRIIFAPAYGRFAVVPRSEDAILIHDFDVATVLASSQLNYLMVISEPDEQAVVGEAWRYAIKVIASTEEVTYTLEHGPRGMQVDQEGVVTWTPNSSLSGSVKPVIRIRSAAGKEVFHKFEIPFERKPIEYVEPSE